MRPYRLTRGQKGTSAVELAIILPLLLVLVFGIVEWSLYLFNRHIITNASREGARYGALFNYPNRFSPDEIREKVRDYASAHLVTFGTADLEINEDPDPPLVSCTNSGDSLEVIVRYDYTFLLFPLLVKWVAPQVPFVKEIRGTTAMRCE
jgi:Flp pilus assembly protein TadG